MHPSECVKVGYRLTDPVGNWGTITAAVVTWNYGYVIVSWDDENQQDTAIPLRDLIVDPAP